MAGRIGHFIQEGVHGFGLAMVPRASIASSTTSIDGSSSFPIKSGTAAWLWCAPSLRAARARWWLDIFALIPGDGKNCAPRSADWPETSGKRPSECNLGSRRPDAQQ